jgi:integrase
VNGARRGELCAIRWSDVDLEAGTVTIARSMAEGKGGRLVEKSTKTHAERLVSIDAETVEALRRQLDRCQESGLHLRGRSPPLCVRLQPAAGGSKALHPNDATASFGDLRAQLNISGVRLHDLRHFAATRLLVAGVPVRQVSGRLGHANASTTLNVYAHAVEGLDAVAASVLAKALTTDSDRCPSD